MTDQNQEAQVTEASDSLLDTEDAAPSEALDFSNGRPESLPEEFWDEENKTVKADALLSKWKEAEARAKGLRDKLAKGAQNAPKDVAEYAVELPEDVAKFIKADDPLIVAAKPIAQKYGLSKEAFSGFMAEMAGEVAKLTQNAVSPEQQAQEIEAYRKEQVSKLGENGPQVLKAINAWGNELKASGLLTDSDYKAFKDMAYSAETVRVLNILRSELGGGRIVPDVASADGPSRAELEAKLVEAYQKGNEAQMMEVEKQLARLR